MRLQRLCKLNRVCHFIVIALIYGFIAAGPASGDSIILKNGFSYDGVNIYTGMTNNMIRTQDPTIVHNDPSSLTVGTNGPGSPDPLNRAFLDFDLSPLLSVTGGMPVEITSVELNVWIAPQGELARVELGAGQTSSAVSLYAYEFVLVNDEVTWNSPASGDVAGGTPGDELGQLTGLTSSSNLKQTFTSTALVEWIQTALDGDGNARFMLKQPNETLGVINRVFFRGINAGTPAEDRPQLVIEYSIVPEPNGLILMGFAIASLIAYRKKTAQP